MVAFISVIVWHGGKHNQSITVSTLGETPPGRSAAFLHTEQDTHLIWQPLDGATPLVMQSITTGSQAGILPYPDVNPTRWHVAPAENAMFHIVWEEQDGRLRSAVISASGETRRGPITLAFAATRDFTAISLTDNRLFVLWRSAGDQQFTGQIIDAAGRPGPDTPFSIPGLAGITATLDRAGLLHLGWLSSPAPNTFSFYHHTMHPESLSVESPTLLHTQDLASTQAITDMTLNLDETHGYLAWSVMTAEPANITHRAKLLAFPLGQPADTIVSDLRIPQRPAKCRPASVVVAHVPDICDLATDIGPVTSLRWLSAAPRQHHIGLLIAATYTPNGWQPGIIVLQNGAALGYRLLSPHPADAGAPVVSISTGGRIVAAWSGIDGVIPELYYTAQLE